MKEETFQATENLQLENSFGVLAAEDNVLLEVTVGIHEGGETGWFEVYDINSQGNEWYAEGGLWIEGNNITGYDGVFSLLPPIINKLKEWGYNTEEVEC